MAIIIGEFKFSWFFGWYWNCVTPPFCLLIKQKKWFGVSYCRHNFVNISTILQTRADITTVFRWGRQISTCTNNPIHVQIYTYWHILYSWWRILDQRQPPHICRSGRNVGMTSKRDFATSCGCSCEWRQNRPLRNLTLSVVRGMARKSTLSLSLSLSLHCQAPGVIGSALGLVGPVSVYCDWVRWKVWSAASISVWQHVKLSMQIRPWDTLACCWDVKQPTNKQTLSLSQ